MVKLKNATPLIGIVHIVKNNKLMKLHHLKDLQELIAEYAFDKSDYAE